MDEALNRMQQALADQLVARDSIRTPAVEAAFRSVPRHLFVPDASPDRAYSDEVIVTKIDADTGRPISSSSQPTMMAIMLEQLNLQPGQRVLEIGAGTGFNAALMAHIVGAGGSVTTVDIDDDLVANARANLARAGYPQVRVVQADGMQGYAPDAPYDRIILTVAAGDITPAWSEQLAHDGQILLPLVVLDYQTAALFERDSDGFRSLSSMPCTFMTLRGEFDTGETHHYQRVSEHVFAVIDSRVSVTSETLRALLTGPYTDRPAGVEVNGWRLQNFRVWLGLHVRGDCAVYMVNSADDEVAAHVPDLTGAVRQPGTRGLVDPQGDGMVLAMHPPGTAVSHQPDPAAKFALWLRAYGEHGPHLARRFIRAYRTWNRAGRPDLGDAVLRLRPRTEATTPQSGEIPLHLRWHTLLIDWG